MSLKDLKAKTQSAVDFAADRKPVGDAEQRRPVTGPGAQAFAHDTIVEYKRKAEDAITLASGTQARLDDSEVRRQQAEAKVAKFDGATVVLKLDPKRVRRSSWANRSEAEFATKEYAELKAEIANAGGNVQPIKVRVFDGRTRDAGDAKSGVFDGRTPGVPSYEVVYGHRRLQACLELGIPVNAVVVEHLSDAELFAEMDRENRARKNLSAWEQGRTYMNAIDSGLYPSLRRLAESLGIGLGNASAVVQLARLPDDVVAAFKTPLDLQFRWAKPLTDAVEKDSNGVLKRAAEVKSKRGALDATAVFELLVGKEAAPAPTVSPIEVKGKKVASVRIGAGGRATVEFEPGALTTGKASGLAKLIRDYISAK